MSCIGKRSHSVQSEDVKRLAFACVLYLGTKVRARDSAIQTSGVSLREILVSFDIRQVPRREQTFVHTSSHCL